MGFRGKGSQTVKAAKTSGDRNSRNGEATFGVQGAIGDRYLNQHHVCDEHCDNPCPVNGER